MPRQGLNCTLSYTFGSKLRAFRARCSGLSHGFEMIAEEAHARTQRTFFPRQVVPSRFEVVIDCKGYNERRTLTNWLLAYADYVLLPSLSGNFPMMTVSCPSRSFVRRGVPVSGYEFGDRLGSMVFSPRIVFETSSDAMDKASFRSSYVSAIASSKDPALAYFYPTGTQLVGDDAPPEGLYDKVIDVPPPSEDVEDKTTPMPMPPRLPNPNPGPLDDEWFGD